MYYGVIGGLAVLIAAIVYVIDARTRPRWRLIGRLAMAGAISALLVAPVALKYWSVQQREGFGRSLHEAAHGAATPGSYLEVPPTNLMYGRLGILTPHDPADQTHRATEQNLFPGFVLVGLALAGLLAFRRRETRTPAIALAIVAAAGFVLSLGPDGARWLYSWLDDAIFGPGHQGARFAARSFGSAAGLAAFGID